MFCSIIFKIFVFILHTNEESHKVNLPLFQFHCGLRKCNTRYNQTTRLSIFNNYEVIEFTELPQPNQTVLILLICLKSGEAMQCTAAMFGVQHYGH